MVLLTMTPPIVRALRRIEEVVPLDFAKLQLPSEPTLAHPQPGHPISHSQLIDLSKLLKKHAFEVNTAEAGKGANAAVRQDSVEPLSQAQVEETSQKEDGESQTKDIPTTLDALLRGSSVYQAPPSPKKEQSPEYKALMARLRAEEEAREYERMLNPFTRSYSHLPKSQTFSQRFPNAPYSPPNFSVGTQSTSEDDELSYADVHRQVILIINVLVSVVACAIFIWMASWHWSAPKRLGLSMGGSGAVAIAEVVVYNGYVRKVAEAKRLEKKKPEIKEIVQSWVIERSDGTSKEVPTYNKTDDGVRYRKGKHR
ncbi:unnamed protein product [Periconia digitata]|uniref:ATPase, vacuolar ER assembly factor, Vma12 n=1 Tax=Periconia digitata TaxID=1303443 RepID=A0A9W4UHX6_9PLEO|nr:unnamed protein product [Periconia digitata]